MSAARAAALVAILLAAFVADRPALAAEADAPAEPASIWPKADYEGDLWSRRHLTGDWGGWRTRLAERGVTLSVDVLQTYQGIVDGGLDENDAYGGSADYELHLETERLGLWPGGFLRVFAESSFGKSVLADAGVVLSPSTDALFPLPEEITTLTSVSYVQFLAPWAGVMLGKLDTLSGDANAFASGRGKSQFLNLAFVFNPTLIRSVPYTALGGGLLFVFPENLGTFSITALDALGRPDVAGFEDAFDEGTVLAEELRIAVHPFGLPGHQLLGGAWSSRDFTVFDQDRRLVLEALLRRDPGVLARADSTWGVYYNFDQYLFVEEDPTQGVGLFFRFGIGEDRTNPLERFYSFGFGGTGAIPGRERDTFGIGYYRLETSDDIPQIIDRELRSGQGFEVFYNVEVLPWLHVTPDLQVIEPSAKRIDTDVILGLRVQIDL